MCRARNETGTASGKDEYTKYVIDLSFYKVRVRNSFFERLKYNISLLTCLFVGMESSLW